MLETPTLWTLHTWLINKIQSQTGEITWLSLQTCMCCYKGKNWNCRCDTCKTTCPRCLLRVQRTAAFWGAPPGNHIEFIHFTTIIVTGLFLCTRFRVITLYTVFFRTALIGWFSIVVKCVGHLLFLLELSRFYACSSSFMFAHVVPCFTCWYLQMFF